MPAPVVEIGVGAPVAGGRVGVRVHAYRPPNWDGKIWTRVAEIAPTDTALQKAQKIATALREGAAGRALDITVVPGSPPTIRITGKDGWIVTSNTRVARDDTQERTSVRYDASPRPFSVGVLGLRGVALGQDGMGFAGGITLETNSASIYVATLPGMSSQQLENDLCIALNSQGVQAWIATPNDCPGGICALSDSNDGSAILINGLDGNDTLTVQVADSGLEVDALHVNDPLEQYRPWRAETLFGDCNGDGEKGIIDALAMSRIGVGLDVSPMPGSARFDACNASGVVVPNPGATIDVLDALTLAQELVATPPPAPGCPPCMVSAEMLAPPATPAGYRYVGVQVVVNFVWDEMLSTVPVTRPDQPTDLLHIRSHTLVMERTTCCDIIVAHLFERI